jgi:tripartite-type tricarboxylate transporter receptor subunit TctC
LVKRVLSAAAAIAAALMSPATSNAQEYPTKPVKVLIGFASGGPTDLIGRIMSEHLSKALGQPFVVESKPGASGVLAGQALVAAPADGYTIYVVSFGVIATAKAMMASMTYDPAVEFAPISMLVKSALIVEVSTKTPVKTWQEFVPWAKANSGKLNHGSPGVGTQPHLAAELLRQRLGFDSQHVAYRGTGPFMQGMMQKELEWAVDSPSGTLPLLKGNHIRAIAVASEKRWPEFPDVPTLTELGMADAVWPAWFGLVTRTGVAKPIIDKIAAEVAKGWKDPDNVAKLRTIGYEPWATTPEETTRLFAEDRERWTAVVKANHIKAE